MNKQLRRGFIFTAMGTYSNFLLQIIIQMVLSRLLTPKEYGVVAIMQVFILFFSLMIEAGMGPAIIQNKQLTLRDNEVLFNFSVLGAAVVAILFGLFGLLLADIYGNSIYIALTWIQAISVFFSGLNVVPTALLNKKKQFKAVNFSMVFGNVCAGIVGVSMAFAHAGVYALILSAITSSVVNFLWNRFFTRMRFSFSWDSTPLKIIWTFSKNQFGFNLINYFSRNSDNILIGKFMGAAPLANYNKSYQLLLMPTQLIANIMNPVLQPVLSDYQDDVAYIRNFYFKLIHFMALIGVPLSVFLSLSSEQVIYFMFGTQWTAAVYPFSILSLTVWIQLTISSTGAILQARNHSKLLLINGILSAVILVTSIVIGVAFGAIIYVAICYSIGAVIVFCINFYNIIVKSLEGSYLRFWYQFLSPAIVGGIVFILLFFEKFIDPSNIFLSLLIRGLIFLGVLALYIALTSEKETLKLILKK